MNKRKLMLVFCTLVLVLTVFAFVLAPSAARAQGLVEYALCGFFSHDMAPSLITNPDDVDLLESIFEIEWELDYGAYGYCQPRFTGSDREFTKLRSCLIAYKDVDNSDGLNYLDTEQKTVCQTFKIG